VIHHLLGSVYEADYVTVQTVSEKEAAYSSEKELPVVIRKLKEEMKQAAKELEFEKAAALRDRIRDLTKLMVEMGGEG
jgi:excinuclease ABC subunit B